MGDGGGRRGDRKATLRMEKVEGLHGGVDEEKGRGGNEGGRGGRVSARRRASVSQRRHGGTSGISAIRSSFALWKFLAIVFLIYDNISLFNS